MSLWSEKHKKCAFEFVKRGSCKDKENCPQCVSKQQRREAQSTVGQPRYCFSELSQKDSCRWRDQCRFDHNIPEELRQDKATKEAYMAEKEKKRGKCVNE